MPNFLLTAKQDVTSPARSFRYKNAKDLKKGYSFVVAGQSTSSDPSHEEVVGALLLEGFCKEEAEKYDGGSYKYYFDSKEIGDVDFDRASKQFQAQLHREDYAATKSWRFADGPLGDKRNDDEENASNARRESKKSGGGSSGCCSICKCIWKIFKCFC